MTACVNKKSKRVAAVVTASLVGALSIGAPAVALAANANIDMLVAPEESAFSRGDVTLSGAGVSLVDGVWTTTADGAGSALEIEATKVKPLGAKEVDIDEDYKVSFAKADGTSVEKIVEPGQYVVTVECLKGQYAGGKATAKLAVKAADLANIVWFDADSPLEDQTADQKLVYTGSELHIGFADKVAFTQGKDYEVKILKEGTDNVEAAAGVAIKDAGNYVAYVTGLGQYKGQSKEVTFTVDKFVITSGTQVVVDDVIASDAAPSNPTKIFTGAKGTANYAELNPSLVSLKFLSGTDADGKTLNLFDKNGLYVFSFAKNADNENIVLPAEEGYCITTVNKVGSYAEYKYENDALADSYSVNHAKGQEFDLDKISAHNGKNEVLAGFTVSAVNVHGDVWKTGKLPAGLWTVTVSVNPSVNSFEVGGSKVFTVKVVEDAVDADANVFVYYNDEAVTSIEKTFDGKAIKKDAFKVKAFKADNEEVSDDVEFDLFDADGKKVGSDGIVNAGDYTLKITSDKYELTGTTEIPVTVNKVDLSKLYVIGGDSWYGAPYVATHANDLTYAQLVGYDTHVAVSDSKDEANDGEGVESLGTVAKVEFNKHLKMEIFDEDKQEWVEVSYPSRLKDEGKRRVTLTGNKELAKNFEFANDDYTTTVEFIVVNKDKLVFNDVKPGDWFFDVVFDAQANGWMNGYADGVLFGAHDQITRGQVACVLFNMAGADMNETDGSFNEVFGWKSFDDVDGKAYYGEAIAWAKQAGVVNGYGDGTFAPDAPVTREELACMLANYAKKVDQADVTVEDADKVLSSMSDGSSVSEWAKGSVAWAVENEIMGNAGFVNAFNDITRAETAAMVVNYKA